MKPIDIDTAKDELIASLARERELRLEGERQWANARAWKAEAGDLKDKLEEMREAVSVYADYANWRHEEGRWIWLRAGKGPDKAQWALEGEQS